MDSNEKSIDTSLESTIDMSQDEIEKLLLQYEEQANIEESNLDDMDLESLLAGMEAQDNAAMQDISELLSKSDHNEAVDEEVMALLKSQEEEGQTAYDAMDLFSGEGEIKKEGFLAKLVNKIKKNKEEKPISEVKEKKKTSKKRKKKQPSKETIEDWEQLEVSEDYVNDFKGNSIDDALSLLVGSDVNNDNALQVSDNSKEKEKKVKKKSKNAEAITEDKIKEKPKKGKGKEKKKKEKKEKNKKENREIREKEKPTIQDAILELEEQLEEPPNRKKVIMTFLASILILLGFLVVNFYFTGHANKRLAQEAYEEQDYLECYQLLYGQKLNDSQKAMYKRSECILKTDIFWRDYNDYAKNEEWLEGLDKLTQYVDQYPKYLEDAMTWNGQELVESTYQQVQGILAKDYETDVEEIAQIAALKSDVDYTRALLEIVEEKEKREALNKKYPDMLPEEKDRLSQE